MPSLTIITNEMERYIRRRIREAFAGCQSLSNNDDNGNNRNHTRPASFYVSIEIVAPGLGAENARSFGGCNRWRFGRGCAAQLSIFKSVFSLVQTTEAKIKGAKCCSQCKALVVDCWGLKDSKMKTLP